MKDALSTKPSVRRRIEYRRRLYYAPQRQVQFAVYESNVLVSVSDFDYKKLAAQRPFAGGSFGAENLNRHRGKKQRKKTGGITVRSVTPG